METETDEKGLIKKEAIKKLKKERSQYIGLWVAVDDKDRIIAFDKVKSKVATDAMNWGFWYKDYGFKIFKTYSDMTRGYILGLLGVNNISHLL